MRNRGRKRQWWGLTWRQRREVLRLARRRRVHPDPAIRDAAYRWAIEARTERLRRVTIEAFFDSGMSWAGRRAARSIIRAEVIARADDLLTPEEH